MNESQESVVSSPACKLFQHHRLAVGVGVGDGLGAKLVESAGFDFLWAGSLTIAASLGIFDESAVPVDMFWQRTAEIARSTQLPTIIDTGLSYLDHEEVITAVTALASLGNIGISIEEKSKPKTNSLDTTRPQTLMSVADFVDLLLLVRSICGNAGLLIARVETLIAGLGVSETLNRMTAYADAGVDAIIVHSRAAQPDEIVQVASQWDGDCPIGLIPTTYPSLTEADALSLRNVRFVIYANQLVRASIKTQEALLGDIRRDRGIHNIGDRLVTTDRMLNLR